MVGAGDERSSPKLAPLTSRLNTVAPPCPGALCPLNGLPPCLMCDSVGLLPVMCPRHSVVCLPHCVAPAASHKVGWTQHPRLRRCQRCGNLWANGQTGATGRRSANCEGNHYHHNNNNNNKKNTADNTTTTTNNNNNDNTNTNTNNSSSSNNNNV